jgi:hypothetical protein
MLEYYLVQQGFNPIGIQESGEDNKDVYSVFEKGDISVEVHHYNVFDRPTVRSVLIPIGLSLYDFESFVLNLRQTEKVFEDIISDCIQTPSSEVKQAAAEYEAIFKRGYPKS